MSLPTWQKWWSWLWNEGRPGFISPLQQQLKWDEANGSQRRRYERAIQWRVGKFYYSAFREVEFVTRMREEYDLFFRYHVLADVLLRADFWLQDIVICTYFPNPRYRSGRRGRKPPAERFLGDAQPRFTILDVEVERQGYGQFWTLTDGSLQRVANRVRKEIQKQ
jgi:hypothetical protein